MSNVKNYTIEINGLKESIDGVDALNKQLDALESRIKAVEGKAVNVGSGGGSKSELSEQAKLEEQIAKNIDKIAAARTEDYKALLMQKQILKEINNEQKSDVAGQRLDRGGYANTMAGLKQELYDIKALMQNTDLGSEKFKDLTERANQLTTKLKEIEQSYGVYSRSVGNYANGVAEGIVHARQELKGLKTEMQDLANKKRKGIITQDEEERLKSVVKEYNNLKSTLEDANKPMDAMMDTVQSIVAIVSAGKGIASFFGLDGNKVEESLKKLLALQNAMQGLQTIQKQMSAGDGLGKYFASMNSAIDTGTKKLLVYNRAILGTGKAAKITAVSIKALGTALKSIGIGLVIAGIVQLLDLLDKWLHKGKEVTATMQAINDIVGQAGQGYAKAKANISMAQKAIDNFNGSAKEEKKLLDQLNSSTNGLVANCKNLDEAKQKIVEHADEYLEMMKLEAQAQALLSLYVQEYAKIIQKQQILSQQFSGSTFLNNMLDSVMQNEFKKADVYLDKVTDMLQQAADLRKKFFTEEKEETEKNQKDTVDSEQELQRLRIDAMKDGLAKKLRQLDEEKRQTLNKVKGTAQQKLDIEKKYDELRLKEIQDYLDNVKDKIESSAKSIANVKLDINASQIETVLEKVNFDIEKLEKEVPRINYLLSSFEYDQLLKENKTTKNNLFVTNLLRGQLDSFSGEFRTFLENNIRFMEEYGNYSGNVLKNTFLDRITEQKQFYDTQLDSLKGYIQDRKDLLKEQADEELRQSQSAAKEEWRTRDKELKDTKKQLEEGLTAISGSTTAMTNAQQNAFNKMKENLEKVEKQIKDNNDNYARQIEINKKKFDQRYIEIDKETKDELKRINNEYFETQLSNYRDFNSKLNQEMSKQPVYDKIGFGIINLSATRENFKEMESAAKVSLKEIKDEKKRLSEEFNDGLIDEKDYNAILNQLNDLEFSAKENLESIKQSLEDLGGQWWGSIDQWIQQIGQATTSILSSLSEITSNHYQEQIDQQQEYLDKLSDLYDKQQDITQKHADALNDIEDELASARGDRRQQLIDALNEEMAAQRASLAQEKRIEAEQERAEKKRKELELDKAKAEKKMQEWQAGINAVMAVSMAAVNHWPVPAIPMMAMAAAVGAAQLAAVKSKPLPKYAEGGVIQGKSHSQGGVKVLGGTSEVEGGEMIINKVTTNENTELLYHINSKKRRLNIDDFIDFYSSGKKTITSISPMRKYANGGQLPTMRTDIDLNDRLVTAFEEYANTPTVVSVVDIQNASERVNNVRVLSGLNV